MIKACVFNGCSSDGVTLDKAPREGRKKKIKRNKAEDMFWAKIGWGKELFC